MTRTCKAFLPVLDRLFCSHAICSKLHPSDTTWSNAFDDRLTKNGLGQCGAAARPTFDNDADAHRAMQT